ncbi:MAG: hypothetical protein QMD71_00430 [bacterium]|nr:hypothetical protein [bacterium]
MKLSRSVVTVIILLSINISVFGFTDGIWEQVASPTTSRLCFVYFVAKDDGWAVGDDGIIIHYDGNNWSIVGSPTGNVLWSVYFTSPDTGWAVGNFGTILQYDGEIWNTFTSPTTEHLYSVFFYLSHQWVGSWLGS